MFGDTMPAGTVLHLDPAGVLDFVVFRRPFTYRGLLLEGTGDGPHHAFFPDGKPRIMWLTRTQEVQGAPCRPISFWTEIIGHSSALFFHPSGRLRTCRLGHPATIQGRAFGKGERVEFDSGGRLVTGAGGRF